MRKLFKFNLFKESKKNNGEFIKITDMDFFEHNEINETISKQECDIIYSQIHKLIEESNGQLLLDEFNLNIEHNFLMIELIKNPNNEDLHDHTISMKLIVDIFKCEGYFYIGVMCNDSNLDDKFKCEMYHLHNLHILLKKIFDNLMPSGVDHSDIAIYNILKNGRNDFEGYSKPNYSDMTQAQIKHEIDVAIDNGDKEKMNMLSKYLNLEENNKCYVIKKFKIFENANEIINITSREFNKYSNLEKDTLFFDDTNAIRYALNKLVKNGLIKSFTLKIDDDDNVIINIIKNNNDSIEVNIFKYDTIFYICFDYDYYRTAENNHFAGFYELLIEFIEK